ncbi:hypothetical protein [Serratia symbiotica]|uniref:Uncharacterized protein n=1 Tax=Serratia symbiotica TaxID=138074 RepID=A0A7D5T355_9GAMM|nr:hypothetical protein [Serratia symbiotica]QLH64581.1 hypothetical protein SYMBAF_17385 [Serratia symbiotica]
MNKFSKLLTAMLLAGSAFSAATATSYAVPAPIQCQTGEIAALDLAGKWICIVVK